MGERAKELKTDLKKYSAFLRTLMCDLEHRPHHLVLLLALVRGVFGVFHLVGELEERVFDVVEAVGRGFAVLCAADGWHFGDVVSEASCGESLEEVMSLEKDRM